MLGVFEKIAWGMMALFLVALGLAFFLLGMPSTQPYIVTASRDLDEATAKKNMTKDAEGQLAAMQKALAEMNVDPQGRTKRPPTPIKYYKGINQAMFERISNVSDALAEAELAEGELKDGRWHIKNFAEDNLFGKIGLEENDQIESVNLLSMADLADNKTAGVAAYSKLKSDFEQGIPVVVNLRRKGRPIQLIFTRDSF